MKPKVYVTRLIPEDGLELLRQSCDVKVWDGELPPPRDVLLREIRECDAVLTLLTEKVDGEFFDAAPKVKCVANMAVGFDNMDVAEATRRGVFVTNTPGVLTETTADFAWALLMAAARRVVEGDRFTRAGKWKTWGPKLLLGQDVYGATLGIIGFGRIGVAVARRARGFNMRILYYDVYRNEAAEKEVGATFVDLDTLFRESDFVSLHVNLTPETRHLINAENLRKMKRTAVLVNTSRGPVVDQKALYEALRDGVIFAAGLDVTDPEPIPMTDPLLTLENCIIAPHIASASVVTRAKMSEMAARNILAALNGELPPNALNPEVYKK